jgi:hypothetical protein
MRLLPTVVLVSVAALCSACPAAIAADYAADPPVTASPPTSPLLDPCPFQAETATQENFADTEVEPFVAVNPINPDNVVGVFQEDRWSDGARTGCSLPRRSTAARAT